MGALADGTGIMVHCPTCKGEGHRGYEGDTPKWCRRCSGLGWWIEFPETATTEKGSEKP